VFKKIALALALGLTPSIALAQGPNQFFTYPGNYFFPDKVCIGTTSNCLGGGSGGLTLVGGLSASNPFVVNSFNGNYTAAPVGLVIGHINETCQPYNPVDAAASHSPYPLLDSNGLRGATISIGIANGTFPGSAPFPLGTVVIPDSPQLGPWVTSVTSAIAIPYMVQAGDGIIQTITVTGNPLAVVSPTNCLTFIGP